MNPLIGRVISILGLLMVIGPPIVWAITKPHSGPIPDNIGLPYVFTGAFVLFLGIFVEKYLTIQQDFYSQAGA